jgi:RND family efflux transporter MFP subunit
MTKGKIISAVALLIGLILVLVWVQGGFHSKVPGGRTKTESRINTDVKTYEAVVKKTKGEVTVSGEVESRETARVAARVQGEVVEINADAGDKVEKGLILVRINSSEMRDRVSQAKAELERAEADLTTAEQDYERYKSLYEKDSVAKKTYDDAKAGYEAAQARVRQAKAAVEEAETMLSYTKVKAPFKGIVGDRQVNLGDMAAPGRTLMTLFMPDALELVASAGEQYAPFLEVGDQVEVEIPSLNLNQKSEIREIVPQSHARTRTITIKAPLDAAPGLRPGLYGVMTFTTKPSEVVRIPGDLVKRVGQLETVKVLTNGDMEVRSVKTGRRTDDMVDILSGLSPGDKVVVEQPSE